MSHWNYRVLRRDENDFTIIEAYYDEAGELEAYTLDDACPGGFTLEDLAGDLKQMTEALERPVLSMSDLPPDRAQT
jgi:hypothetical protein